MLKRRPRMSLLVASLLLIVQTDEAFARGRQLGLRWNELAPVVSGHKIAIVFPPAVRVEGKVLAVRIDALEVDISKTSDRVVQPRGPASIPRSSVSTFELRKPRMLWRIIGTAAGTGLGILMFVWSSIYANERGSGATGAEALWIAVGAGGGYLSGWAADGGQTTITVLPDSPQ